MEYGAKVAGKVTGKPVAAFTSGAGSSNSVLLSLERNDRSLQNGESLQRNSFERNPKCQRFRDMQKTGRSPSKGCHQ